MKKHFPLICILSASLFFNAFAQVPEKISYQGVARNLNGTVLPLQNIGLRYSIHSGTANGAVVYQETHATITNDFGLFNVELGGGTVVSGTFSTIDWGNDLFFLQTEMDVTGGTSYLDMGTSQLVSVPYALYAKNSGTSLAINGTDGYVPVFTNNGTGITDSDLMYNEVGSGTFGIGTTTPDPSAIVDISSASRGILFPRMTTNQRFLITPAEGLFVYDITTHSFWYYDGTAWVEM